MRRTLLIAVLLLAPVAAHADAAVKAQEGEINHWIEYYEKQRGTAGAVTLPQEEREKRKEERKSPASQGRTGLDQHER